MLVRVFHQHLHPFQRPTEEPATLTMVPTTLPGKVSLKNVPLTIKQRNANFFRMADIANLV